MFGEQNHASFQKTQLTRRIRGELDARSNHITADRGPVQDLGHGRSEENVQVWASINRACVKVS